MSEADLAGAPGPLYQRVKRYITERIVSGELGPGARVPPRRIWSSGWRSRG
jgi:DNA-binding GntR family transcriptional regulator